MLPPIPDPLTNLKQRKRVVSLEERAGLWAVWLRRNFLWIAIAAFVIGRIKGYYFPNEILP